MPTRPKPNMYHYVLTLHLISCAEKDSVSGRVMMAWIWRVRISATVFVSMAQAPPKAGAKELLYSLQSNFDPRVFSTNLLDVGLPRKAFPRKQAKVDTAHQCFSVVVQATPQDSTG